MKTVKTVFPLLLAIALAGCATPGGSSRQFTYVDPEPDGYYTGGQPDFADRFNPDPQGRKFRVEFLRVRLQSADGAIGGEAAKASAQRAMDVFYGAYMAFREQARDSYRRQYYESEDCRGLRDGTLASLKSGFSFEKSNIAFHLAGADVVAAGGWSDHGGVLGEPVPHEFMRHWEDAPDLNAELARRYPALFTTDDSGFPLEIVVLGLYVKSNPVVRTRFEAWVVGLPEHANIRGYAGFFTPFEVFLDPYDAVAAALFKLTDEQFEGLVPANPKDREWPEEK